MQKTLSVSQVVTKVLKTFSNRNLCPVALETGKGRNADVLRALCLAAPSRSHRSIVENVRRQYNLNEDFVDGLITGWDNQAYSPSSIATVPSNKSNSYRRGFNCGRTAFRRVNDWYQNNQN